MQILLDITSAIMDAFLLTVYFISVLGSFHAKHKFFYILSLSGVELLLYINQVFLAESLGTGKELTVLLSVLTTFLLSLFFECRLYTRILYTVLFQLLSAFSDTLFTWLVTHIQPELLTIDDGQMLYAVMGFGTTATLFFLILLLKTIKSISSHKYPIRFHFILLITPIITVLALAFMDGRVFYSSGNASFYIFFIMTLTLINVINYIEIEWSSHYLTDRDRLIQMEQQINYQKEKYDQLSNSYKQSRSFLHDIRKHFFTMQEYIHEERVSELSEYIEHSFGELEHIYAKYNTGNLVIDSFITNYAAMAAQRNIRFDAVLRIDKNRIPMKDYDLCVVLGNLLDNAITASTLAPTADRYIQITIETTKNDLFMIRQENSMDSHETPLHSENPLDHGFGLKNIERTLEHYHGIMDYSTEEVFRLFIRVPITDPKQRITECNTPPQNLRTRIK